jgi:hypothetical protein
MKVPDKEIYYSEILSIKRLLASSHNDEIIKHSSGRIGSILVESGALTPVDLKAVLSIQKELRRLEIEIDAARGERPPLGELLRKAKRITRVQLDHALGEQRREGRKLGELLVRSGLLTEHERNAYVAFQRHGKGEPFTLHKPRLGDILVATGQITRDQLGNALNRQEMARKKIGDLLVEAGHVEPHQVEDGLKIQQKLATVSLIAALSLSDVFVAEEVRAAPGTATATVGVNALVRERISMEVLNQAGELSVTSADIRRGYVTASAASRISVKTNNRAGCLLAFEFTDRTVSVFHAVTVLLEGREVRLSSGAGWIHQPYTAGASAHEISYRFDLSADAQPGTYPWPITISALPLGSF